MLTTIQRTDLDAITNLSAVSPEAALRRPLAELVQAAVNSAAHSKDTARSYPTAIGLFLQYLDSERGHLLSSDYQTWRPFASKGEERITDKRNRSYSKTLWEFRGPSAILRLVDASVLDGFRSWRESQGDGANTASIRVYAVRTFLSVALRDGVLAEEQGRALGLKPYRQRQKRDEKPVGLRLTPDQVKSLRKAIDTTRSKGKRDLAILDVMLYAGLRCEETATLNGSNFRQDGGRWWIVLTGKGDSTRRIKVHDALYRSLVAWCEVSENTLGVGDCLFQSINKVDKMSCECINTGVVNRIVAEYGAKAGITPASGENRLSPHDIRRTAARNAFDNGASLLLVQAMLGHKDPKTTAHYIGALEHDDDTAVDYVRY